MKFKSNAYTQVSGSVGGTTYAHNKGGMYARARAIPTNPNSIYQQAIRGFIADLTQRWTLTLTEPQRAAWRVYATNVPLPDAFGDMRTIPALSHYIRSNVPRLQIGASRIDPGPTTYNLGQATQPVITVTAPSTASVAFTNTDEWYTVGAAGALIILASRPQLASIEYFKGPYLYCGYVINPDASPKALTLPFPCVAGQKVFFQVRATQTNGRLSLPFRFYDVSA